MSTPNDYGMNPEIVDAAKRMLDCSIIDNNIDDINSAKVVYHHYVEVFNEEFPNNPIVIEDKYL